MKKIKNYNYFYENVYNKFLKIWNKKITNVISNFVMWLLMSQNCILSNIARALSTHNWKSLNTNVRSLERLLQNIRFQIDDKTWRMYHSFLWWLIIKMRLLNEIVKDWLIQINIDYTTKKDKFLILSASIPFKTRYIPLYFSMRVYPKKKWQINQKRMEEAFIKALKHLLPRWYRYCIVADRWFSWARFINLFKENGFEYVVRSNDNRNIEYNWEITKIKYLEEETSDKSNIKLINGWIITRLITKYSWKSNWFLLTSLNDEDLENIVSRYWQRFKIEKMFQDQKSSWFDIESSKIEYYDRFKKLLFLIYIAQSIIICVWDLLYSEPTPELSDIKKNKYLKRVQFF